MRGPSVKIERDSDPQEMRNLMNQADENWNRRASPALREQVEKLTKERDEYKSGFEAAASKYRNLKLQMQEVINVC